MIRGVPTTGAPGAGAPPVPSEHFLKCVNVDHVIIRYGAHNPCYASGLLQKAALWPMALWLCGLMALFLPIVHLHFTRTPLDPCKL